MSGRSSSPLPLTVCFVLSIPSGIMADFHSWLFIFSDFFFGGCIHFYLFTYNVSSLLHIFFCSIIFSTIISHWQILTRCSAICHWYWYLTKPVLQVQALVGLYIWQLLRKSVQDLTKKFCFLIPNVSHATGPKVLCCRELQRTPAKSIISGSANHCDWYVCALLHSQS